MWSRNGAILVNDYLRGRAGAEARAGADRRRHGLKEVDREMMKMLDEAAVSYRLVLTKADKIKASELADVQRATEEEAAAPPGRPSRDHRHVEREGSRHGRLRAAVLEAACSELPRRHSR